MSLVNKLLKKNLIDPDIKNSVITGRGNIKENFPSDFTDSEIENVKQPYYLSMVGVSMQVRD